MALGNKQTVGIIAALSSAFLLGLAPVFGRWAILSGFSSLSVVALRTGMAAGLMFLILVIFRRQVLYIFPVGLVGCLLAGSINGLGSLLYYMALGDLPASVGQLLYALYPIFVALFSVLDKQTISRLTMLRVVMALAAVFFLTNPSNHDVPLQAVLMMIGAAALYALHIPINQRVLYEIPAPTVTFYTLLAMSMVTIPAYLIFDRKMPDENALWLPVLLLTLVTFASRFTLFLGIKKIGGVQTALLGLSEIFITILVGHLLLGESLTPVQWVGAGILGATLMLASFEKPDIQRPKGGWLAWISPPQVTIPWNLDD
jgi:drug/metabolite transporter (DMT)-like permease